MKTIDVVATAVETTPEPDENQKNWANVGWFIILALIFFCMWVGGLMVATGVFAIGIIFGLLIGIVLVSWVFLLNYHNVPPNQVWITQNIFTHQKIRSSKEEILSQERPVDGLGLATTGWLMLKSFCEVIPKNGKIDLTKKVISVKNLRTSFTTKDNLQVKVDARTSAEVIVERGRTYFRYAVTDQDLKADEMPEIVVSEFVGLMNKFFQEYISQRNWKNDPQKDGPDLKDDLKNGISAFNAAFIKLVEDQLPEFEWKFGVRLSDALIIAIYLTDAEKKAFDGIAEAKALREITTYFPNIDQNMAAIIAASIMEKKLPITLENVQITASGLEGFTGDFNYFGKGGGGGQGQGKGKNKGGNPDNQGGNNPNKGQP